MLGSPTNPARRALLSGKFDGQTSQPVYPPWSLAEDQFLQQCSQCNRCVDACPTDILSSKGTGFPVIDFSAGECTFCRQCLDICPSQALMNKPQPWSLTATISHRCLTLAGIACQSCVDMCEVRAIRIQLNVTGTGTPLINQDLCTGCGACYQVCPANAVEIDQHLEDTSYETA